MSKRHNRKRTRSRPRHRDPGISRSNHTRTLSMDTNSSWSSTTSSFQPAHSSLANTSAEPWQQTHHMQNQHRILRHQQAREKALEAQRLRFFGGYSDDEVSLFEPMLKVVTDLFDGNTDYEDP